MPVAASETGNYRMRPTGLTRRFSDGRYRTVSVELPVVVIGEAWCR
jgi:hypothetical protein